MNPLMGKALVVTGCNGDEWYASCVNETFIIQGENEDQKKYKVRTTMEQAGWRYGWVNKQHASILDK